MSELLELLRDVAGILPVAYMSHPDDVRDLQSRVVAMRDKLSSPPAITGALFVVRRQLDVKTIVIEFRGEGAAENAPYVSLAFDVRSSDTCDNWGWNTAEYFVYSDAPIMVGAGDDRNAFPLSSLPMSLLSL